MRKINRAVKVRIYPNAEQRVQIEKTIGCSRFIYNCMLADKMEHYKKEKKMLVKCIFKFYLARVNSIPAEITSTWFFPSSFYRGIPFYLP